MGVIVASFIAALCLALLVLVYRQLGEIRRGQESGALAIEHGRAEAQDSSRDAQSRHNDVTAMRGELQLVRSALRAPDLPVELDVEELSDEQMLNFAAKLCHVRPLVPYPRSRFGSDWSNPDVAFQFRKQIWTNCRDQSVALPFQLDWHHGIKLELHLGNDVSLLVFGHGCYEPNEFAFLERFLLPGMKVLDAGANEGLYSLFAAAKVGRRGMCGRLSPAIENFSGYRLIWR